MFSFSRLQYLCLLFFYHCLRLSFVMLLFIFIFNYVSLVIYTCVIIVNIIVFCMSENIASYS